MVKELQTLIFKKKELLSSRSLTNTIKIYFLNKKMKKIIKKLAQKQADIIYRQTYELYDTMIKANFK